jgi:lipopolysaccharide/colanic/teichoic acid biosynthesis glycosyltransferase
MEVVLPFEESGDRKAAAIKNITTVGFGNFTLSDVFGRGSYVATKYPSVESMMKNLPNVGEGQEPDFIVCCDSLIEKDIRRVVDFIHSMGEYFHLPIVLLTDNYNIKSRIDIFNLGIDDVFDEATPQELFYERLDLIKKTKQKLLENDLDDQLQLSVANIEVSINIFKRIGDVLIASMLIIALLPLFILVAIMIKLESKGPVFYNAKRAGSGYKIFDFYKFRSMAQGSDQQIENVKHLNQYDQGDEESKSVFIKIKSDPRVTKVGAFLRKTSIDELPQLINVLKGDMSLVGNRPLPLYEAQQLTRDNWVARFNAPAGITGLWQISKRGKAAMSEEERVELDVEYSRKHSFWYDLWILIRTVPVIFQEDDV